MHPDTVIRWHRDWVRRRWARRSGRNRAGRPPLDPEPVRRRIASLGITEVVSSPRSPWQNPYVDRVIGSLRRECLNHVIVVTETHLRRILRGYLDQSVTHTF